MTIVKSVSFPDNDASRQLLEQIARLGEMTHRGFSEIAVSALICYVERETPVVQSNLEAFKSPMEEQLDKLHLEFLSPNPKGYGTWAECLKKEGLHCDQAIEYSRSKNWIRQGALVS